MYVFSLLSCLTILNELTIVKQSNEKENSAQLILYLMSVANDRNLNVRLKNDIFPGVDGGITRITRIHSHAVTWKRGKVCSIQW